MFVQLTADGHERFRDLLPRALALWEEVQAGLSKEEQSLLSHLLAKLRVSLFSRYIGRDLVAYRLAAKGKRRARGGDKAPPETSLQLSPPK
jgi:hypothetical protein